MTDAELAIRHDANCRYIANITLLSSYFQRHCIKCADSYDAQRPTRLAAQRAATKWYERRKKEEL